MMSRLSSVVKRHPLVSFFVLAYAFSWWAWIPYAFDLSPSPIVGFGPFFAALIVLAATQGKTGAKGLLSRMVRWRVGLSWYAVALLLPVAITGIAAMLNVFLLGAQGVSPAEFSRWPSLIPTFFLLLLVPGIGGAWEEPGWRGYALPRLQTGRSALVASLILGPLWALWHLPLIVVGQVHWSDILLVIAVAIVLTWMFNNAQGSVLIVMLMHAMNNTISGSFFSPMFSGADSVRQSWLLAALWSVLAIGLVIIAGPELLSRKHHKQEEPSENSPQPLVYEAQPRTQQKVFTKGNTPCRAKPRPTRRISSRRGTRK